ncbi:ComF family protein [Sphingomonas floccifaciens]|uniref:ComF family protein n=1 Tax=Sphingomonas floccifaciens TaxID=1844115 RepID=A0ABW4NI90_9SPHN
MRASLARDKRRVHAAIASLVSLALPPRCPGCSAVVEADHRFCAACWGALVFLGPPWCAGCALPFEHDRGPEALCGRCLAERPEHDGARAAVAYGPVARAVALRLKYGRRTAFAETAARLMHRVMPEDADLLVSVPLHRWRLWTRGYNQAALIADALGRMSGIPARHDLLHRTRATPSLRGLGGRARTKAVRGAFAFGPDRKSVLAGRSVVLVDDVFTTGATASACAKVLRRAGAARVTILCWARVIDDTDDDASD